MMKGALGETDTVSAVESFIAPSLGTMIEAEMSAGGKRKDLNK